MILAVDSVIRASAGGSFDVWPGDRRSRRADSSPMTERSHAESRTDQCRGTLFFVVYIVLFFLFFFRPASLRLYRARLILTALLV